jgi:hypothetical protein
MRHYEISFDQSADRLISHLKALGHDVKAISRDYQHSLPDEAIMKIARTEERILIVADREPSRGPVWAGPTDPA